MNYQLGTRCKSLAAGFAREPFLSGVDAFMSLQVATPCKSLPASLARDQIISSVNVFMHSQMPVIFKRFATYIAFKSATDTVPAQGTLFLVVIATGLAVSIACRLQAIPFHWCHRLQTS